MALVWKLSLLLLACLVCSVLGAPTIHWITPRLGSLAGGTTVSVYGRDFATDSYKSYNLILIGEIPCIVINYLSSPTRLQCITEPYPEAQEGSSYTALQSSLISDSALTTSSGSHNRFTYHWSHTPQMMSIVPNSGPVSAIVELGGHRLSGNPDHYASSEVFLGNSICNVRNEQDSTRYGLTYRNSQRYLKCHSTEKRAGAWNGSLVHLAYHPGKTWNHSQSLYPVHDWSLAMYELFPDIHDVTPQAGSVKGGAVVTITGTGFQTDGLQEIEVDIDGIPCRVVSSLPEEIKCVAGEPPPGSPAIADSNMAYPDTERGHRFRGSRGVNYLHYSDVNGHRLSSLYMHEDYPDQPDYYSVYPSYSTIPTLARKADNYGARFTAFFNPHASGDHTFFVTNDNEGRLWFSQGSNISEVDSIVASEQPTSFTNFYQYDSQRADTLHLEEAEDYLLVGELKESGGNEYFQVGLLMHETDLLYKDTKQVVRETQTIELSTAGLYQIQRLQLSLNMTQVDEEDPPQYIMEWGGRETGPLSLLGIGPDVLTSAITHLLSGICDEAFGLELGYGHYNDIVYGFEDESVAPWISWGGSTPVQTNENSFCGRQSLHVLEGRARAPYPNEAEESDGVRLSDYPFLCLAYNVPRGHDMVITLNIRNIGWRSILTSSSQLSTFDTLGSFWDFSNDEYLQDDNEWHFSCADLLEMLSSTLTIEQDPENDDNTIQSTIVDGLGFYSAQDTAPQGFHIDEVSFSSEMRQFEPAYYFPPSQPNGIPIHTVNMEETVTEDDDVVHSTYLFTIIPTTCETNLPLINLTLIGEEGTQGVLEFEMTTHQQASAPIGGYYTLSFESNTTIPLSHSASALEIKSALEALDSVNEVTVGSPQTLTQDYLGTFCPGRKFEIIFENHRGDLPLLDIDSQNLVGSDPLSTVEEVTTGGLFLRPIPGHMLQTAEITPQVHVRIRGQLAACSGKNELYEDVPRSSHRDYCGFRYGPTATPTVTSVDPGEASSGEEITLSGTSFSENPSENYVTFGGVECTTVSSTTTSINCRLGSSFAGFKGLHLHVLQSGVAETNGLGITYDLSILSINPLQGSDAGETQVNITGTGFYDQQDDKSTSDDDDDNDTVPYYLQDGGNDDTECPSAWRNLVSIGGQPCAVVDSTATSLTITTPETPGGDVTFDLEVCVVCPDNVTLSLCSLLMDAFTYDSTLAPSLFDVTPTFGTIQGGQTVTITGDGFSTTNEDNKVFFGDAVCLVTMSTETLLTCITPPHIQQEVEVSVVVAGRGKASGTVLFTYNIQLSSISHCTGSVFGGQVLTFEGRGFGESSSQIAITLGDLPCEVVSAVDEEILCVTSPATQTHQVNNNEVHEEYGRGYRWSPSSLVVHVGDTVQWSWTGTSFATRRGVAQTSGPQDTAYDGMGFRSEQSTTGSYSFTFTTPGTYYYITEGYAHIGFRGMVTVLGLEDIEVSLSISFNHIPINISDSTTQCNETSSDFNTYTYSASATPILHNLARQRVGAGDTIILNLTGISDTQEDNVLVFGGNTNITCSSSNPPILSSSQPARSGPVVTRTYSDYTVECVVPDLPVGRYRPTLHVAGKGWGYSSLEHTMLTVQPQIVSPPSIGSGSLRGGLSVAVSTHGLSQADVLRTRVEIGNTPCRVQSIDSNGILTCFTQAAVDDGYSSLIQASSPLAYWSLQADYHRTNGSYLDSDGLDFFRSGGSLGAQASASVHGEVDLRQSGISGNNLTDQSILFSEAAFLRVPGLGEMFNPTGFSLEFWMKVPHSVQYYRIVVDAFSSCNTVACGYVVVLNPCHQVEFWVANEGGEVSSGDALPNQGVLFPDDEDSDGIASGGSSDDIQEQTECSLITDTNQCAHDQICSGHLRVTEQSNIRLPAGTWSIVRSGIVDLSEWNHIHIGWETSASEDCTACNGVQELVVNGDRLTVSSAYTNANSGIEIGGSSSVPLGTTGMWSGLAPFTGYLDEVAYYNRLLEDWEISNREIHIAQQTQQIWISAESFDGVGTGSIPNVWYPIPDPSLNFVLIDWDSASYLEETHEESVTLQFQWTMSHGVRQVSRAAFESCDLEADYIKQWAVNVRQGSVNVPLETGGHYYFIDSVTGGCLAGRKLSIQVGNVHVVEWRIDTPYDDITLPEGTGIIFRWSGSFHNLLEMSAPVESDCKFVNSKAFDLGQVGTGWLVQPATSGEVVVNGLSVGNHYFACSVGDHCVRGMRLTVTVESGAEASSQETQIPATSVHTVQWLIQDYEDMTITEGDAITFSWDGFHSLHQVTEEAYTTCSSAATPLYVWGEPSVDNRARVEYLTPGDYYFICTVAGHCSAGMKVKVTVLPNDGIPVLSDAIPADCGDNCHFSYSADPAHTPQLTSIEPVSVSAGSALTLHGTGLLPPGTADGDMVDSMVKVWLGDALCSNVVAISISPSEDVISCTAPNYESGHYYVDVHVQGKGFASLYPSSLHPGVTRNSTSPASSTSPYPHVFLEGVINSVSPGGGSVLGGTELTIHGSGFSTSALRLSVRIGEVPCAITSSSHSEIICITGQSPLPNGDLTLDLSVVVNEYPVVQMFMFTYSVSLTPVVSSLNLQYTVGGEDVTISGSGFGLSEPQVQIVSSLDSFAGSVQSADECAVMVSSDTEVTCTLPVKAAGQYLVLVIVPMSGYANPESEDAAMIEYALSIHDFSPAFAGYGGGVVLTVSGQGFPTLPEDQDAEINVTLCDNTCSVLTSNLSTLTCILSPSTAAQRSQNSTLPCNLMVNHNSITASSNQSFVFSDALTPRLASVTPSIGGTAGGTRITLSGAGFFPPGVTTTDQLSSSDIVVRIDGAVCEWDDQTLVTDTEIQCLTGSHRTTLQAQVQVTVQGKGMAENENGTVIFEYIDLWSSRFTWGDEDLPAQGESVYIRTGQTVFLDVSPPELNLLLIEGALVFSDTQDLHLQAKYIFVNNGTFQVGTEENPFQHKATITLHGNITDPEIPIYGAKVLGVRQGYLDLHGRPRHVTWTRLAETAVANATSLTLQQQVDWVTGDRIVVAPTGKNGNETEELEIESVSSDGRTVQLTTPLNFTHHGITETLDDGNFIEIRAEVGLLSHNIIIEGATQGQSADQYGAQIFIHRMGPHPTPIRIEHVEVRQSGQAFRLGRYSIHFHLSGSVNGSYVRHCSIHHSFNRAITAHGVHDLLIEGNVAYDIMGHTFFIEDGVETGNRYMYNLGVLTRGSSSLLNTDQLPATFWITNPQNTFIGNAAAASRAYGFWYDLDNFPSGASYTRSVCPNKATFGEFRNNTAHTCSEFGLRIWETYIPYVDECSARELAEATLNDFTTYGNGIHGVELSVVGHVQLSGFRVADNVVNGIEIQETMGEWGGPQVKNSLIISHTSVNNGEPQTGGLKTPNTPKLTVTNVTFANFDLPTTSCLRACSHCKPFQGGFEVHFQQLRFIGGSENYKTAFQWEFEVLYRDLDGSLTGLADGGWVVPNSPLVPNLLCTMSVPEFSSSNSPFAGTVCSNQVHFLRMAWNEAQPLSTLEGVNVNVSNEFGITEVPWRHYRLTHMDGYMFTMPQGHAHSITWLFPLTSRVDTTSYQAGVYGMYDDSRLWITHDFVMLPDHVTVGDRNTMTDHGDVPTISDENFSWFIDNQTDTVTYLISGANLTSEDDRSVLFGYNYDPCPLDGCPPPGIDYGPYESRQRRWSDPNSWPSQTLPVEGDNVTVSSRWRMLLDMTPPSLGNVYILGELTFEDQHDYNFTANLILVYGPNSRLIIGTEESPFTHQVTVTLTGRKEERPLVLARGIIVGSKAIGIFGNVSIHGVSRQHTWSRLNSSVMAGSNTIQLPQGEVSSWSAGDQIVIAPSGYDPMESEIRTIQSNNEGLLTLTEPLEHDHLIHSFLDPADLQRADPNSTVDGSSPWWGDGGFMAPEVGVLTHNIVIQGGEDSREPLETHHYGCRIFVGRHDTRLFSLPGNLKMDSVEVRFCGQGGYFSPRDPRYAIAFRNVFESSSGSYIKRSSIHHGYNTAIGIHTSSGVEVSGNVIWRTTDSSVKVGGSMNIVRKNLAMMTTTVQPNSPLDNHAVDFPATFDVDSDNIVRDNAAAGSTRLGFQYAGEACLEDNESPIGEMANFWGNTAHSGLIGLNVLGLPYECTAVGGFSSTHQWNYGVFSSTASSLVATHLKVATGKVGVNLNIFGPNPVAHLLGNKFIRISDSLIVGSLPGEACVIRAPDFWVRGGVSFTAGDHKLGIMMASFNQRRSKMDGTGAWHLMKGYPVIDGVLNTFGVSFARFTSNQNCSYGVYAVGNNPLSPDAVHPLQMVGTNKFNVDLDSLAFFYEPDPAWIVQEDCVDMDCDGPKHSLVRDIDGRFVGTSPSEGSIVPVAELRFSNYSSRLPRSWLASESLELGVAITNLDQLVGRMGIARGQPDDLDSEHGGCERRPAWQGYRCKGLQHHMLVIESLDADTETRRLSPLALHGGDTGAGEYTDLINGPMDHGWCTYYTCLKRLSTFFTIVAVDSDYCVWMTGSSPSNIRFHLLNAGPQDAIKLCIWFKSTQRKDVYKNGVYIEPENVQFLDGGTVLQTDGNCDQDCVPSRISFGGANYFHRESHIMHVIVKGSDPVEIRTAPVVQVSLSLAVSLDDFFDIGELINNIAFVLGIDKSRIRVVKIVSEVDSGTRSRRSLLAASAFNHTSITLEFGNPPAVNISMTPPPSIEEEIEMAREVNDSVDLEENTVPDVPLDDTNPLNEDTPDSAEDFADNFNSSALDYVDEVLDYHEVVQEIEDANILGEQLVNLILTGGAENITNSTVLGLSVTPALPPPPPEPPVIPPMFENATDEDGEPIVVQPEEVTVPTLVLETAGNDSDEEPVINFVFPSSMRVTMEPLPETGHLVHVAVTIFDDNDNPVINLGLVNPWMCEASLVSNQDSASLEGETSTPFMMGVAEFTRLRVDRPAQELSLMFRTNPTRFEAATTVRFRVVAPPADTLRKRLGFVLRGNLEALAGDSTTAAVQSAIRMGLGLALDVDVSRIEDVTYTVTPDGIVVEFDLLESHSSDPPNVPSLSEAIASMEQAIASKGITISINGQDYTTVPDSFEFVTLAPPTRESTPSLPWYYIVAIACAAGVVAVLVLLLVLVTCYRLVKRSKETGKTSGKVSPIMGNTEPMTAEHPWATGQPELTSQSTGDLSIADFTTDRDSLGGDCWMVPSPPHGSLASLVSDHHPTRPHQTPAADHGIRTHASLAQMANPTGFDCLHSRPNSHHPPQGSSRVAWAEPVISSGRVNKDSDLIGRYQHN